MLNQLPISEFFVDAHALNPKPNIPVCVPQEAFRIEPGAVLYCYLMCKDNKQWHLVYPDIADELPSSASLQRAELYRGSFEDGSYFLLPVTQPQPEGNDSWYKSWLKAIKKAEKQWVIVEKNHARKRFEAHIVVDEALSEPEWSELSIMKCAEYAFKKKNIASKDHPMVTTYFRKSRRSTQTDFEDDDD